MAKKGLLKEKRFEYPEEAWHCKGARRFVR